MPGSYQNQENYLGKFKSITQVVHQFFGSQSERPRLVIVGELNPVVGPQTYQVKNDPF